MVVGADSHRTDSLCVPVGVCANVDTRSVHLYAYIGRGDVSRLERPHYTGLVQLPRPLQRAKDLWMAMSHAMGRVVSWILLSILWALVFGVYALIMKSARLFRRSGAPDSYWKPCPPEFPESMRHQF